MAVDPTNTDEAEADWGTAEYQSPTNSVIQENTAITTFPDVDGNVGTTATDPGGYQVGLTGYWTRGSGQSKASATLEGDRKKGIYDLDIVLILGKNSSGSTINITTAYETEQDW